MAKPLRYGPTIGVRLPIEIHDAVIEMAGPDGPGPWIRDLVVDYVPTCVGFEPDAIPVPNVEPPADLRDIPMLATQSEACAHTIGSKRLISGGLTQLTCGDCKAVKTGNGPWIAP